MKRLLPLVLAISSGSALGFAAPAPDASSFTVAMHVSRSKLEIVPDGKLNGLDQNLEVTVEGHHLTLAGNTIIGKRKMIGSDTWLLPVGDYKAKVLKEDTAPNGVYWREYQLLLKDGSTWNCYVIGESE